MVTQILSSIVFCLILIWELANYTGLGAWQIVLLSIAKMVNICGTAEQNFPYLLDLVLEAYNMAITSTFINLPFSPTAVEWD